MGVHVRFLQDDSELHQAKGGETILDELFAAQKVAAGVCEVVQPKTVEAPKVWTPKAAPAAEKE